MKLEDKIISDIEYSLNVVDDGTDIVLQESYMIPKNYMIKGHSRGVTFSTIKLDFIPVGEAKNGFSPIIKDSFAPENRWY